MSQHHNRRAVAITVYAKCRKKYGPGTVKASACTGGASVAFGKSNTPGSKTNLKDSCRAAWESGDPDVESACFDGIKMFDKGIKHIGPRLAGRRRR